MWCRVGLSRFGFGLPTTRITLCPRGAGHIIGATDNRHAFRVAHHSRSQLVILRGGSRAVRVCGGSRGNGSVISTSNGPMFLRFGSVIGCFRRNSAFVFGSAGMFPTHLCNAGRGASTGVRIFLLHRLGTRVHL